MRASRVRQDVPRWPLWMAPVALVATWEAGWVAGIAVVVSVAVRGGDRIDAPSLLLLVALTAALGTWIVVLLAGRVCRPTRAALVALDIHDLIANTARSFVRSLKRGEEPANFGGDYLLELAAPPVAIANLRPGARAARSGAFACLALLAALGGTPAAAQQSGDRPSVLLVLDSSRSMRAPAGDGSGSRMDAAKAAVDEVLDTVPEEAPLGLRVYGSKLSNAPKRVTCTDTELVAPVQPGGREELRASVEPLVGTGRTPIGRSLLATPGDFPDDGRRHQVILVSDGLDNCSPPSPCNAARRVARRGVELTISVVGFALDERARRQMRCIARVGGGTYVDANDTDKLREELLAAFARAFRNYVPSGTPVQGGPDLASAPVLGEGLYQGELSAGKPQTFAVDLAPGERLFAAGTLIVPDDLGHGTFRVAPLGSDGEELDFEQRGISSGDTVSGRTETLTSRTAPAGMDEDLPPGRYGVQLTMETDQIGAKTVPFELAVEALEPDARPGLVREPGPEPQTPGAPSPTPTPTPARSEDAAPDDGSDGGGGGVLAGVAAGGLLAGLAGGFVMRRRRPR